MSAARPVTRRASVLRALLRNVAGSHPAQTAKALALRPLLARRAHPERQLNFYFLSTGRVGTRFYSRVLGTADNATVLHQPEPQLRDTAVAEAVRMFCADRPRFASLRVQDFPRLHAKLLQQAAYPSAVYGDTLNHMFPFGLMLYRYFGPERLRLVHLVRDPVDCGRSMLKAERGRPGQPSRFADLHPREFLGGGTDAEQVASVWNGVNGMIAAQFQQIDDPRVCRVVRLEDQSLASLEALYGFLGLTGFDEGRVRALMEDPSHDVRHSHVRHPDNRAPDATPAELALIAELCAPLARSLGYPGSPHA